MDREAAARAVEAFLRALGHDPARESELSGTGARVAQAWADDLLAGYAVDVDTLLEDNAMPGRSEAVVVRDVAVHTMCPHHLLPGAGVATVAYAPDARLVGVGTVARIVDAFARRLSLQERIGEQVVASMWKHLSPRWVACRLTLTHACMTARGERAHGASVESLAYAGPEAERLLMLTVLARGT
jgi:GTP cyclohydrolase I